MEKRVEINPHTGFAPRWNPRTKNPKLAPHAWMHKVEDRKLKNPG